MSDAVTHAGFADESHWNMGRFRSLGLVTTALERLKMLEDGVRDLLNDSGVEGFEWKKLRGARERFAAEKLCRFAVEKASQGVLRVDVLIWDIEDRRHKIPGRDDIANLERMYYHLFRNVLRLRWPNNAVWRLHPDEHTALDWETIQDCLENVSVGIEVDRSLFAPGSFRLRLRREFGVEEIKPVSSDEHPLLQLADLFAGLAVFSWDKFDEYEKWLRTTSPQLALLPTDEAVSSTSSSTRERFPVLKEFDSLCKQKRLGVSLNTHRGLRTLNPKKPINFWMYEPQHPEDKAPRKGKR